MRFTTGTIVTRTVRDVPRLGLYLADDEAAAEVVTIDGKVKHWPLDQVREHNVQDVGQFSRIAMRVLIRQAQELEKATAVSATVEEAVAKRKALIEKGAHRAIRDNGYAAAVANVLRRTGLSVPPRTINRTLVLDMTTRGTSPYAYRIFPRPGNGDHYDTAITVTGMAEMVLATTGTGCVCAEPVTREQINRWYPNAGTGLTIVEVRSVFATVCTGAEDGTSCCGRTELARRVAQASEWRATHTLRPNEDGTIFAAVTPASQEAVT